MSAPDPTSAAPAPAGRLGALEFPVLQQCLHCGLCLPSCPTYAETGLERHGPRGRIALLRAVALGELPMSPAIAREMEYCLGCLACTSACPAGVRYAEIFEAARAEAGRLGVLATPFLSLPARGLAEGAAAVGVVRVERLTLTPEGAAEVVEVRPLGGEDLVVLSAEGGVWRVRCPVGKAPPLGARVGVLARDGGAHVFPA